MLIYANCSILHGIHVRKLRYVLYDEESQTAYNINALHPMLLV